MCCLSASGNCDHKNVAVERENHKLLSFIKLCNQYKTIFMPMVFSVFNDTYLVLHRPQLFQKWRFVVSLGARGGVGEPNEKFRFSFERIERFSPDKVMPMLFTKMLHVPFCGERKLSLWSNQPKNILKFTFKYFTENIFYKITTPFK